MILSDTYKVRRMLANGASEKDIIAYFSRSYTEEEVRKFFPVKPKKAAKPRRKPKADT